MHCAIARRTALQKNKLAWNKGERVPWQRLLALAFAGPGETPNIALDQGGLQSMAFQSVRVSRFGGPEVLELVEEAKIPEPRRGEVRIKVLAAGTGFTDCFIRMGRYPDFKGPFPYTPGYDLVGVVETVGAGVSKKLQGALVADLSVVGGYTQYAIRPAKFLVPVPEGVDPAEAVCIPLAYMTAFQMLTRYEPLPRGATILVIGASGTVGTALLDLARHLGLRAIGTCSAANLELVRSYGAEAIDYRSGNFVPAVRKLTADGRGVDVAYDAIGGPHFKHSFACLAPGGRLVGYGSQTMATGHESLASAALGLLRLYWWDTLRVLYRGRRAAFYNITARRKSHAGDFKADMITLFELLRTGAIHPVVVDRLPLSAARALHERIERGGLGGKIVLLPWQDGTRQSV
jgi:NADPH:quinone reductase-like Zn-dependent oxidoreductase